MLNQVHTPSHTPSHSTSTSKLHTARPHPSVSDQPALLSIRLVCSTIPTHWHSRSRSGTRCCAQQTPVLRPHIDDVDRLSRGDGARRRGTGCREIPHRLNAEERPVYESAKKKGYLAVRGTGYRRERKGNPLPNIYRQWCDATATACVVIEQDWAGGGQDVIVVDMSTLRMREDELHHADATLLHLAHQMNVAPLPPGTRTPDAVPFNIILPATPATKYKQGFKKPTSKAPAAAAQGVAGAVAAGGDGQLVAAGGVASQAERVEACDQKVVELEDQAAAAAAEVRRLKEEEGWPNSAVLVKEGVAHLQTVRAQLDQARTAAELARMPYAARQAALFEAFGGAPAPPPAPAAAPSGWPAAQAAAEAPSDGSTEIQAASEPATEASDPTPVPDQGATVPGGQDEQTLSKSAIWAVAARPLFFSAGRQEAKAFAKEAAALLTVSALSAALPSADGSRDLQLTVS